MLDPELSHPQQRSLVVARAAQLSAERGELL